MANVPQERDKITENRIFVVVVFFLRSYTPRYRATVILYRQFEVPRDFGSLLTLLPLFVPRGYPIISVMDHPPRYRGKREKNTERISDLGKNMQ